MTKTEKLIKFIANNQLEGYDFNICGPCGWIFEWCIKIEPYGFIYYTYNHETDETDIELELIFMREAINKKISRKEAIKIRKENIWAERDI